VDDEIGGLYRDDRREHGEVPPIGTPEYRALRERDRGRRTRVAELLDSGQVQAAEQLYQAAWILNHGDLPDEARRAHELALRAAATGHRPARWLAAAAFDRWRMYSGLLQKYGTQFVPDGRRQRLWDVEPDTTDAERAEWDVPPLTEQLAKAVEASRYYQPEPIPADAPQWLLDALERWRARGEDV
jgi:hypothetical protein